MDVQDKRRFQAIAFQGWWRREMEEGRLTIGTMPFGARTPLPLRHPHDLKTARAPLCLIASEVTSRRLTIGRTDGMFWVGASAYDLAFLTAMTWSQATLVLNPVNTRIIMMADACTVASLDHATIPLSFILPIDYANIRSVCFRDKNEPVPRRWTIVKMQFSENGKIDGFKKIYRQHHPLTFEIEK
jgi:hypothetical protein